MEDVADYDRKFEVWLSKNVPGTRVISVEVDVPAGVDANEVCEEAWHELIGCHIDSEWRDITED